MTREELRKMFVDGVSQAQAHSVFWNHMLSDEQRKAFLAWNNFVADDATLTNLALDDVLRRFNLKGVKS